MTDAMVLLDHEWRIVFANRNVEPVVDRTVEELIGRNHWELFPETRGSELERLYHRAVETGQPQHFQHFSTTLKRWLEIHAHPSAEGLAVFFRDVTERRNSEAVIRRGRELLARNEAQLRLITNVLPAYICYIDPDYRYARVNSTYLASLQLSEDQIIGHTIEEILGPTAVDIRLHLTEAFAGLPQHFETRLALPGGERILSITHVPDRDESGTIRGVVVQGFDITERKRAEAALRESEERFRRLSASSPVGIFQSTIAGSITYANPRAEQIFHLPEAALLEHGWLSRLHPEDVPHVISEWSAANAAGLSCEVEYRLLLSGGAIRHVRARTAILRDDAGAPCGVVGTVDDITDRKLAEEALRQNEKLAAVGRLASSIAHEINNPLESVTNLLYLARGSVEMQDIQQYLELAERELRRVSAITNQTLRFHKQSTSPTHITTEELLESALSLYQGRLVNSRITVQKRLRANRPILCFDGEIRQVLSNLIANAIDAMSVSALSTGGTLYLRAREAFAHTGLVVTLADTGPGMPSATLARIFEPFFTTKDIGGTGLGLWISKDIIARHEGSLNVRSSQRPGRSGTVFTIFLPFDAAIR